MVSQVKQKKNRNGPNTKTCQNPINLTLRSKLKVVSGNVCDTSSPGVTPMCQIWSNQKTNGSETNLQRQTHTHTDGQAAWFLYTPWSSFTGGGIIKTESMYYASNTKWYSTAKQYISVFDLRPLNIILMKPSSSEWYTFLNSMGMSFQHSINVKCMSTLITWIGVISLWSNRLLQSKSKPPCLKSNYC